MSSDSGKKGIGACSPSNVHIMLKISNMINACLLALAAILALIQISFEIILLVTAGYVALFALCLLCFELRLSMFETLVYRNFGFMFGTVGRAGFFIFIGSLSIAFNSIAGWIAVAYTGANMLFNLYCMAANEGYREWLAKDNAERRAAAMKDVASTVVRAGAAVAMSQARATSGASSAAPPPPRQVAVDVTPESAFDDDTPANKSAGKGGWEKLYDEKTKLYYYHNHATGETRWEEP